MSAGIEHKHLVDKKGRCGKCGEQVLTPPAKTRRAAVHRVDGSKCGGTALETLGGGWHCVEHDRVVEPFQVEVGDFFVESWGYDQTNIDFYKVVGVTKSGASVKVQAWSSQRVGESGYHDAVVPGEGPRTGAWVQTPEGSVYDREKPAAVVTKRLQSGYQGRPSIKVRSWGSWARLWEGKPAHQTASGFGH